MRVPRKRDAIDACVGCEMGASWGGTLVYFLFSSIQLTAKSTIAFWLMHFATALPIFAQQKMAGLCGVSFGPEDGFPEPEAEFTSGYFFSNASPISSKSSPSTTSVS